MSRPAAVIGWHVAALAVAAALGWRSGDPVLFAVLVLALVILPDVALALWLAWDARRRVIAMERGLRAWPVRSRRAEPTTADDEAEA